MGSDKLVLPQLLVRVKGGYCRGSREMLNEAPEVPQLGIVDEGGLQETC